MNIIFAYDGDAEAGAPIFLKTVKAAKKAEKSNPDLDISILVDLSSCHGDHRGRVLSALEFLEDRAAYIDAHDHSWIPEFVRHCKSLEINFNQLKSCFVLCPELLKAFKEANESVGGGIISESWWEWLENEKYEV